MEQITDYIEKFKDGLPSLFENVIASYQNKINDEFQDEYNIPEHEYVQSHPLVQLKPSIYTISNGLLFSDYDKNCLNEFHNHENKITPLFTVDKLLPDNEYIIFINIKINKDIFRYRSHAMATSDNNIMYINKITVIYISNYGRIISHIMNPYLSTVYMYENVRINGYQCNISEYFKKDNMLYYKHNSQPVINSNSKPLTYKFPKLFLDVINAFRNESTDEMQKCCEQYNKLLQKTDNNDNQLKSLKSLKDNFIVLEKKYEETKINNVKYKSRINELERNAMTSNDQLIKFKSNYDNLLLEKNTLETNSINNQSKINNLEYENKILKVHINQLEKTNIDYRNKLTKLEYTNSILESSSNKFSNLEDENTKLKKEIELLKIQLEEQRKHFML